MPEVSLAGVAAVAAIAFVVPLALGLSRHRLVPAVVLELAAGAALGPSGFGLFEVDVPLEVLSVLGLAFLLFLAGLEVDLDRLRGRLLAREGIGLALSLALAAVVAAVLAVLGAIEAPLLVAIALTSTSLGVVVPVLKDAGRENARVGQLVLGGAAIADLSGVVLLTLLFGPAAATPLAAGLLLAGFVVGLAALGLATAGAGRNRRLAAALTRLQDTSGQLRVRGAWLLLGGCTALAQVLGIELLLGAFLAGVVLQVVDRDVSSHPLLHTKLHAVGYGVFVPFFFVVSGARLDLPALVTNPDVLRLVPLLVVSLLVVRGLPALAYRALLPAREVAAAGLLQATSLPFLVAVAELGRAMGLLGGDTAGALVLAGLISVSVLPVAALGLLRGPGSSRVTGRDAAAADRRRVGSQVGGHTPDGMDDRS